MAVDPEREGKAETGRTRMNLRMLVPWTSGQTERGSGWLVLSFLCASAPEDTRKLTA